MKRKIYGLYQGRDLLFHGTIDEISEETSLSKNTLKLYKTPGYLKKNKNTNALRVIEEWNDDL